MLYQEATVPKYPMGYCCVCQRRVTLNIHGTATAHHPQDSATAICAGSEVGTDVYPGQRLREALAELRVLESAERVDHSGHVDTDGEPCGESRTWKSKLARDVAMVLDRADVPESQDAGS
jgi:hypothetical protein